MKARRELARDYANGTDELGEFFQRDFRSPPSPDLLKDVAQGVDSALVDEMQRYNELLGADERTLNNIAALREHDAVAVVTGQQAGIFTGPLYTVYKALAAVKLSERYSSALDRKVVPIFWVAGDDHDFEEIRSMRFVDWRGRVRTLTYAPPESVEGLSAFNIPADGDRLAELVRTLDEETSDHDEKGEVVSFLQETLSEGGSLADWFGRLILKVFRETGLVVFFAHEPRARQLAAKVLEEETRSPGATTELISETSRALASLGYGTSVEKKPNETHFFLYVNGKRRKVLFERDRYYLPDDDASFSRAEMEQVCVSEPERLSPNVVLRPVVQGAILPVLDYVAGPGEIGYWAQLRGVFERFGVPMARVFPRPHVVLVTGRCTKLIERHNVDLNRLVPGQAASIIEEDDAAENSVGERVLSEVSEGIVSQLDRYLAEISAVDASLGASAAKLKQKVEYQLEKLNRKAGAARDRRAEKTQGETGELSANLLPNNKPQERVLNIFPYLMESGWTLTERLMQNVDVDITDYQILHI
jgi:bacillithiol biosynthesis cysteine-adding enzyme BshC